MAKYRNPELGNGKDGVCLTRMDDIKYYRHSTSTWTDPWAEYMDYIVSTEGVASSTTGPLYVESTYRFHDAESRADQHIADQFGPDEQPECAGADQRRNYLAMCITPLAMYRKTCSKNAHHDRTDLYDRMYDGLSDYWYGGLSADWPKEAWIIVEERDGKYITQAVFANEASFDTVWYDVVAQRIE